MHAERNRHLDPAQCLRILNLSESASAAQIKHAYRLMALRFHPDRAGRDANDRTHFELISNAYRYLMKAARLVEKGKAVGQCCVCREFGEAVLSMDGMTRCPRCALRPEGKPLLPLPPLTVVKCLTAIVLLAVAVFLLIVAIQKQSMQLAAGGVLAGSAAVLVLAIICIRVVYCIQPREARNWKILTGSTKLNTGNRLL